MKDTLIQGFIEEELARQNHTIELIASENIVSQDVLNAVGSVLTNKYSEGKKPSEADWKACLNNSDYKSLRYYNGCGVIDKVELTACKRFKELFNTDYHVNVQPHSGAQANMAVFEALLNMGDTVLSMDLSNGGHLSHGSPVNYSGKHFDVIQYGIDDNGMICYDEVEHLALKYRPKLIICGASNYSKIIDFKRFAEIRDKLLDDYEEHYLLADIAHIAGLVASGCHPSPFGYADVVTTTTHKSLRGPRGGVISCKQELATQIDKAVFPGIQGGPLEHVIAGKAVCFFEALQPEFKEYGKQIIANARALCSSLLANGLNVVGGMTENHLMTLDLRKQGLTGKEITNLLEQIGITANKNTVPNDPQSPFVTSGIRLGVPAVTTRGFTEEDMTTIGKLIATVVHERQANGSLSEETIKDLKGQSLALCEKHPLMSTAFV